MKKVLVLLCVALAGALPTMAGVPTHMRLHLTGEASIDCPIEANPRLLFGDGHTLSLEATGESKSIPFASLESIELVDINASAIASLPDEAKIDRNGCLFVVRGFAKGSTATVCDLNGRVVLRQAVGSDTMALDCSSLAPAVYIIKVVDKAIKFVKK